MARSEPASQPPAFPEPAAQQAARPAVQLALAYALLLAVLCPEIFLHPATKVIANHGDGFNAMLWWHLAARGEALKPWTPLLFHPFGVDLAGDKGHWLLAYLSVPLQLVLPLVVVYNLSCLAFFVATAWTCAWAAQEMGASRPGAAAAGALLVLSPAFACEMSQGSTELTALMWLLAFVALGERARRAKPREEMAARSGLLLVLASLTTSYQLVYASLCCLVLPLWRLWRPLLLAGGLLALPLGFQLWGVHGGSGQYCPQVAREAGQALPPAGGRFEAGQLDARETQGLLQDSVDYGRWLERRSMRMMSGAIPTCVLVVFAAVGVLQHPRSALPWAGLAVLCGLLSLGPALHWKGSILAFLPTEWLYVHLPLLVRLRPSRFLLPGTVALALCAAHAVPRLPGRGRGAALASLLVLMQLVETLAIRELPYCFTVARADVPSWYRALAAQQGGAVLEVPCGLNILQQGKNHFYQAVHGHPTVNYDFMRPLNRLRLHQACARHPVLAVFWEGRRQLTASEAAEARRLGIRWIILHGEVEHQEQRVAADDERDALFDPALFNLLRSCYGEPEPQPGGLWVFDLARGGATRSGTLQALAWDGVGWCAMSKPGTPGEVQVWARGRGLQVQVRSGAETLAMAPALASDDWTWVRVPLADPPRAKLWVEVQGAPPGGGILQPSWWQL